MMDNDSASPAQLKHAGDVLVISVAGGCMIAGSSGGLNILLCRRAEHEPCRSGSGSVTCRFNRCSCLSLRGAFCNMVVLCSELHIVQVLVLMTVGLVGLVWESTSMGLWYLRELTWMADINDRGCGRSWGAENRYWGLSLVCEVVLSVNSMRCHE